MRLEGRGQAQILYLRQECYDYTIWVSGCLIDWICKLYTTEVVDVCMPRLCNLDANYACNVEWQSLHKLKLGACMHEVLHPFEVCFAFRIPHFELTFMVRRSSCGIGAIRHGGRVVSDDDEEIIEIDRKVGVASSCLKKSSIARRAVVLSHFSLLWRDAKVIVQELSRFLRLSLQARAQ